MRTKRVAHKKSQRSNAAASRPTKRARAQQDVVEEVPTRYSDEEWSKKRRERLEKMAFGNNAYLDWKVLRAYDKETPIRELLNVGPWAAFLELKEPAYREITLEVLSTLKLTKHTMTFQAYGQQRSAYPYAVGAYLGLYSIPEVDAEGFKYSENTWPSDMTPQACWAEFCEADVVYDPSHSKASLMTNVDLRIVHHLLAHTIGGRKSSHAVVNNHELFILFNIAQRIKINVGLEVAKFLYRQASDPRCKGIYCGGYITKLLKGLKLFREPQNDHGLFCEPISDGPFHVWGLAKVLNIPTPSRYSAPRKDAASTSKSPPTSNCQLMKELQEERELNREERELNRKEREKNKRFRQSVWRFLGRLASCFSPPPADLPIYESSPEPTSPEIVEDNQPSKKGKAIIVTPSSDNEEESDDEEDEMEEDEDTREEEAENHEEQEEDSDNGDSEEQDDDDYAGSP